MSTNPFQEAGTILHAIHKSEKRRDAAIANATERHGARHHGHVQELLAAASPEARAMVVEHLNRPKAMAGVRASDAIAEVEADRSGDDTAADAAMARVAQGLLAPIPPLDAVVKDRSQKGAGC